MDAACDTIVVGAGPGGATAALQLARHGKRVIMLDAAAMPRQKVCGEYLGSLAWQTLAELGLTRIRTHAMTINTLRVAAPYRPWLEVALPEGDQAFQPAAVSRRILDGELIEAAVAAGVTFLPERRVRDVVITHGKVTGLLATSPSKAHQSSLFTAPQIIAADGRHSLLVRRTGVTRFRSSRLMGFKRHWHCDPSDELPGNAISMFSLAGGYVGLCRTGVRSANLCGMMPCDFLQRNRGDVGAALISACHGHESLLQFLATAEPDGAWTTIADVPAQSSTPRVDGVLYVGDAMGTIEPLTGQGMTMAILSAVAAARRLADCDTIDRAQQLAYAKEWHASFDRTRRMASWFGSLLRRPGVAGTLLGSRWLRRSLSPRLATWAQRKLAVASVADFGRPEVSQVLSTELAPHG